MKQRQKYYRARAKKCSKDLFGVKKFLKSGDILNSAALKFLDDLPSAGKTFILSQLTHKSRKRTQMTWNREEKSLALAIYKTSPKAYRLLRKMFVLPSPRTLHRSLRSLHLKPGLNEAIVAHMASKSSKMDPMRRYASFISCSNFSACVKCLFCATLCLFVLNQFFLYVKRVHTMPNGVVRYGRTNVYVSSRTKPESKSVRVKENRIDNNSESQSIDRLTLSIDTIRHSVDAA